MCPFYPAKEGLTIAEVTEGELGTRVERKGADVWCKREAGKVVVERRRAAK